MEASAKPAETVDEYIAGFPVEVGERLEVVRALVREVAPAATETISYGMPTYKEGGATLVHFAAFKNHIGLYGASRAAEVFAVEIGKNKTTKGSIQFPSDRPLPVELIRKIVEFRVREAREQLAARKAAKARKARTTR
ncbi:MAG: iron chaperone [Dehalococcoidia bacterium]